MANIQVSNRAQNFVDLILDGGGLHESAVKAGYHPSQVHRDATPVLYDRMMKMVARQRMEAKLQFEAAPIAYKVILEMAQDEKAPKSVRLDAAKYLHSVAGYTPPKAQEAVAPTKHDKDLNDMTTEELRQYIQDGETALANRATDITPAQGIDDFM